MPKKSPSLPKIKSGTPKIKSGPPKIKSGTEEADWYATPEGRRETQREFARALRAGTLSRSNGLKVTKTTPKILE
jgi:hypothetical protein